MMCIYVYHDCYKTHDLLSFFNYSYKVIYCDVKYKSNYLFSDTKGLFQYCTVLTKA